MTSPSLSTEQRIQITEANCPRNSMAEDVEKGLTNNPKVLYPKYLYDDRGSELFTEICALPEYYQTRTERRILKACSMSIAENYRPTTLVEYGAGAAKKTHQLLDAMREVGTLRNYVPIDVSSDFLQESAMRLAERYPRLTIHGLTGDFLEQIDLPYPDEPRLIAFLGSTIGNLTDDEADIFLHQITSQMNTGDLFLLGTDLVKDVAVLEAAYNDSQGVTEKFNKNILGVINRELNADFTPHTFHHHAFYNPVERQIEIHLVSKEKQSFRIEAIDLTVEFEKGESVRTEISCKYTKRRIMKLLRQSGLTLLDWCTDPRQYFALSLSRLSSGNVS